LQKKNTSWLEVTFTWDNPYLSWHEELTLTYSWSNEKRREVDEYK
jgi:hypothetical protein